MGTLLTFADYDEPWEPLDLSEQWASQRAFWAAVLQFATADGADAVLYLPESGDECLFTQIDSELHCMIPPPPEYRNVLLHAAKKMASDKVRLRMLSAVRRYFGKSTNLGTVCLETSTGEIQWRVSSVPKGLCFRRESA